MEIDKELYATRIIKGRIEMLDFSNGNKIAFEYPPFMHSYGGAEVEIINKNKRIPTGDQIAFLIYNAYCAPTQEVACEPEFKSIRDIMKNERIWVFNRNLWTAKGVYVLQDTEVKGMDETDKLEKMLIGGKEIKGVMFSKDRTLRFAPKEIYTFGEKSPADFAKDGFVVASFGEEGAEKLAKASCTVKSWPIVQGIETNEPVQSVSALSEASAGKPLSTNKIYIALNYYDPPTRFTFFGDYREGYDPLWGYAFSALE